MNSSVDADESKEVHKEEEDALTAANSDNQALERARAIFRRMGRYVPPTVQVVPSSDPRVALIAGKPTRVKRRSHEASELTRNEHSEPREDD
jgi:hypothetical protein